eukprot:scaffold46632_cov67-Attheya_sp.AAC.1
MFVTMDGCCVLIKKRGNNFETTHWTGISCVRLRSLMLHTGTCRGLRAPARIGMECYARLPDEFMLFEPSLWPRRPCKSKKWGYFCMWDFVSKLVILKSH